jgi:hypothetical protein
VSHPLFTRIPFDLNPYPSNSSKNISGPLVNGAWISKNTSKHCLTSLVEHGREEGFRNEQSLVIRDQIHGPWLDGLGYSCRHLAKIYAKSGVSWLSVFSPLEEE